MNKLAILLLFLIVTPLFLRAQTALNLQTFTGTIYGTLQTPATDIQVPVVLIIAGSGPTDRDGNNPQMKNNSLKLLADTLQSRGVASLRYDKRGIAASRDAGSEEPSLRFDNYVDDAASWIRLLRKDKRFSKVIVIGHSEGSLIGMIAAANEHADAFISIAGAGKSADLILKEQIATQPDPVKTACYTTIDSLVAGKTVSEISPMLYSLFRPSVQPYLISWFKYDPQKEIAKLKIPILILQGTTDFQVTIEDARMLGKAVPGTQVTFIGEMNHIMKKASKDRQENIATYTNPALPLHPGLVKAVMDFIRPFL